MTPRTTVDIPMLLARLARAGQYQATPDEAASVAREARMTIEELIEGARPHVSQ